MHFAKSKTDASYKEFPGHTMLQIGPDNPAMAHLVGWSNSGIVKIQYNSVDSTLIQRTEKPLSL